MIGKRIGDRYEVLSYIGGGGMSRVYLAHDIILGRDVAIKVLNYDFSNEEELRRRFRREALSATSLTHPNIVDIFDVGEDENIHYLVMEYIEGKTLKEFIAQKGPLTPEEALPIMQQLVSAISNAHDNGIIHRDIKPQNVLMDREGNVKITDFGIAMALSSTMHTKTNSVLGTVHYLSPEQARGSLITKKSDIYSLGIVFYELLTGELPFTGESAVSIVLKHLQEETPSVRDLFPSIPQSVENVILKATAKDTYARYRSADEMQEDLATVLSPERANEEKFVLPFDDEATRAIPAIIKEPSYQQIEETVKHESIRNEPAKEAKKETPKKKRKKWPFIVSSLVLVALLGLLIAFLPNLLGLKKIEIPDVKDLVEAEAISILEEEGFVIQESIEEASDEIEEGKVIKTTPEAGKQRPKGTEITLYISVGKELIEVDNYIGKDYKQIANLLVDSDYKSTDSVEVYSDKPAGEIVDQDPAPGTEIIPSETDLIFTVSQGKERITLEDLTGYSESQIEEYEAKSSLEINVKERQHSDSVPEGQVISQKPSAGTKMEKGQKVSVVISEGKERQPIKHIIQTVTIPYTVEEVEDEEDDDERSTTSQKVRVYIQDRNHSMTDPYEEFTITEDKEITIKIELEEGGRGAYRVMRDNVQIEEETFDYDDAD